MSESAERLTIAFTGPESSGKTSLSKTVAAHFSADWYAEYAREYLLENGTEYDFAAIETIARKQEEIRTSNAENRITVYDTEATVLYVWSQFKYNTCSAFVEELVRDQQIDHYFLCSPEGIPWEEDPLREHPNHRNQLFEVYRTELEKQKRSFTILTGSFSERKKKAIQLIENILP